MRKRLHSIREDSLCAKSRGTRNNIRFNSVKRAYVRVIHILIHLEQRKEVNRVAFDISFSSFSSYRQTALLRSYPRGQPLQTSVLEYEALVSRRAVRSV